MICALVDSDVRTAVTVRTLAMDLYCNLLSLLYQLTWYGHVQRMAEGRLPKIELKWMPKQRVRGRPKENWMEGIKKTMHERNLNEGQWEDRKQWSLGVGQRRKTF